MKFDPPLGYLLIAVAAAAFSLQPTRVQAGTIRHDRPDQLYLDLAANPAYDCVGRFAGQSRGSGFWGTGTLIAPHWVLTAAHILDDGVTDVSFTLGGQSFTSSRWIFHPNWDGDLNAGYDLALVYFDADLAAATGIEPATRYTGRNEIGQVATFVGFGSTGTGLHGYTTTDTHRRAGQNHIDRWLSPADPASRVFLCDFDHPDDPSANRWQSSTPVDLEYLIGPGDSGGPVFLSVAGQEQLAGIHSFGSSIDDAINASYGDASGHVRVSAFNDWIDRTLAANPYSPLLPADPAPRPRPLRTPADLLPMIGPDFTDGLLLLRLHGLI